MVEYDYSREHRNEQPNKKPMDVRDSQTGQNMNQSASDVPIFDNHYILYSIY